MMAFSPAVDVLALIGLQRFRPHIVEIWTRNEYCIWSARIPISVAPAVVLGLIPQLIVDCYQFPMIRRDSAGKYKLVGHAQPVRRPNV
jgi:CRISPR-associated protein Csb3